jgi:hypothetical protein
MPTPRENDEFPSELQKWLVDDVPIDRPPDRVMQFHAEPAGAAVRDPGKVGLDLVVHDSFDGFVASRRPSRPWLAVSIALLFGTVAGFASGYSTAQRLATPGVAATEVTDLVEAPALPPLPDSPTGTHGGIVSDVPRNPDPPVARPTLAAKDSRPAPEPPTPAVVEQRTRAESRSPAQSRASSGQGSIEIASRPSGAQVRLDGRVVGRTPLSLPDVPRGTHIVGIELTGYNRWATSVTVTGDRARVGASLEPAVPLTRP